MLFHLGMTEGSYAAHYADMKLMNHAWDKPGSLVKIGEVSADPVAELTDNRMCEKVDLTLNNVIYECDHLLGPVFPHEVVGFSGGSKYLFRRYPALK